MRDERNLTLPGNPRYQPKSLQQIFGYDNLMRPVGEVEIAVLQVLGEIEIIPTYEAALLTEEVIQKILDIPTTEVDRIERTVTKHDIRAWVKIAQEILPSPLRRWVHIPLTSYDALDTARALQFSRAYQWALKPAAKELIELLIKLTRTFADRLEIGRTHGQHALPITVGFWFATILNRIIYNVGMMNSYAGELVGKISGAVGAYNAEVCLGFAERCEGWSFEGRVLEKLGLEPAPISTQIVPPEPLAYFLYSCTMLSAALGQFGRDCRHLMRSEIAEISEGFEKGQVGSSTMAHKRNPKTFENLEGMWFRTKNEFGKVLDWLISEHQRDLVGSSLARDFPIIVVNLTYQLETLLRKDTQGYPFLGRITIDPAACQRNFAESAHLILAEPIYIALQMAGYEGDAHELVNDHAVPIARKTKQPLMSVIGKMSEDDPALLKAYLNIPSELLLLLRTPERYAGNARDKALEIAEDAESFIRQVLV